VLAKLPEFVLCSRVSILVYIKVNMKPLFESIETSDIFGRTLKNFWDDSDLN
jgi:hypothetical protein